jgi:hypothetical protein
MWVKVSLLPLANLHLMPYNVSQTLPPNFCLQPVIGIKGSHNGHPVHLGHILYDTHDTSTEQALHVLGTLTSQRVVRI